MKNCLAHPATDICRIIGRIYHMDMTTMSGGNLSVKDDEGVIWITPAGIDKASLTLEDIVRILPDGTCEGKHPPTSEHGIHKNILARGDLKAVVHAHPPAAVSLSILRQSPDLFLYPVKGRANSAFTEFSPPGTKGLVDNVMQAFNRPDIDAAVLDKHSLFVASGQSLADAFFRFEEMDFAARIEIAARAIGTPRTLDEGERGLALFSARQADEFRPKGQSSQELFLRERLCKFAARAYGKKLFTSQGGVLSARLGPDSFLILPEDRDNASLEPQDIVRVEGGCWEQGKRPDHTVNFHRAVYRSHPQQSAVIVARPVYSMAFAVSGTPYRAELYPESYGVLRGCANRAYKDMAEDGQAVAEGLSPKCPTALVDNFGLVVAGESLNLAFDRLEVAEAGAESSHQILRMTGGSLPCMSREQQEEMDRLLGRV